MPKQANPLKDTQIKRAVIKEKPYELNDGEGLQLKVRPSGTKTWLFKYHKPCTKKRTSMTLGNYPELSLADARKSRDEAKKLLCKNINPKDHKDKVPDTLKKVVRQWWHIKKVGISENHAEDILRSFQIHIFPTLGATPIDAIKAPATIEALKPVAAKGSLETVRRLCQRLNEIMTYAVNIGIIEHNTLAGIKAAFQTPKKNHMPTLKPDELPDFLKTLMNASIKPTTRNLILWQLHTMVRPSEAAGTQWNEIDLDSGLWTIPAERMKKKRAHIVPLTKQMIALLEEMKKISNSSDYIFPGDRNRDKPSNSSTANVALKRMGLKGELVAHGLRSIASTTLNELGFEPDVVESALAHVDKNDVRAAYNRSEYLQRRGKMMQWWSEHIENALIGGLTTSKKGLSLVG